jgi:Dyp-type peroxidase family
MELHQTNIKMGDASNPMLRDLQANILEHHGREYAFHLLVQITDAELAKKWITQFANTKVTTAFNQLNASEQRKHDKSFDGGTVFTLSLSTHAYKKLDPPVEKLPDDEAFREGMKNRANKLRDEVEQFDDAWKEDGDVFIIVADSNEQKAMKEADIIKNEIVTWGVVLASLRGKVLRNEDGIGIEHFGYADGISQPLFTDKEIHRQGPRTQWDDKADLSILLLPDPAAAGHDSFGSYLVFRKLEQNVKAFKEAEELLIKVKNDAGEEDPELGGAMIVGRFESGAEVINTSREIEIEDPADLKNDFDYRDDKSGNKCPFHAHVRMVNPRSGVHDFSTHRIARRGIPFNDIGRNENDLENDQPENGVGLLFMCYQRHIPNQFEFLQHFWANNGQVGNKNVGQDGIIGQGPNTTNRFLPVQWGQAAKQADPIAFKDFVTMRGGEYFFTPSISGLKNL